MNAIFRAAVITTFLTMGCSSGSLTWKDWVELPKENYVIPPYSYNLSNFKIALDPGHGGNAHIPGYKRGPTGKREAVVNLKVAFFLKEFLERAGATVFMTRTDDSFVSLKDRAEMAAGAGCDFMVSLHHNAGDNPATNYSSVFYHLTPDYSPVCMDLARNIYFGLVEALRLPQVLDDGLLTDTLIYPAGFGLLRQSLIPAILLESSFYSYPAEEKRLTNLRYNRREAYGIFLGLARWAAGGVPRTEKRTPAGISTTKAPTIEYALFDGLTALVDRGLAGERVFGNSVTAQIDGRGVPVQVADDKRSVTFSPDSVLSNGQHLVQVDLENMFKNHSLPRVDTLIVAAPADSIRFEVVSQYVPADENARVPIRLTVFDNDSETVWDGTPIKLEASRGKVTPAAPQLSNGMTSAYYQAEQDMGLVYLIATAGSYTDTLLLSLAPPGHTWVISGAVMDDSTGTPIVNAEVAMGDATATRTDENGFYFFRNPPVGSKQLLVSKDGYAGQRRTVHIDSTNSQLVDIEMRAILGGLLYGEVVIVDAARGGDDNGDLFDGQTNAAQLNLKFSQALTKTLRWAGATGILVREQDSTLASKERIRKVNAIQDGWYLQVGYQKHNSDLALVRATIYPANKVGEQIATAILAEFAKQPGTQTQLHQDTSVPEVTLTNKTAIQVLLHYNRPGDFRRDVARLFQGVVNYKRQILREEAEGDGSMPGR